MNKTFHTATHCNTLQHTATHKMSIASRNDQRFSHCNALQHAATHCNTLQHATGALHQEMLSDFHIVTHCNTLQHTATHNRSITSSNDQRFSQTRGVATSSLCPHRHRKTAGVLQCVAMYCSAPQCVSVCCNILQCAAVHGSVIAQTRGVASSSLYPHRY